MHLQPKDKLIFIKTLIKILTIKKTLNILKIYLHYLLRKIGVNLFKPLPYFASIELTTYCNLRCPQCISGLNTFLRPTGFISKESFLSILNKIQKTSIFVNLYFMGEPFLHKEILFFIEETVNRKMLPIISTNGHFLTKDLCEKLVSTPPFILIISIDGISQETYQKYRVGGNLNKVLNGIENLISSKIKLKSHLPIILLQFIVNRYNENEVEKFIQYAKEKNLSFSIKTINVFNEPVSKWLPTSPLYHRKIGKVKRGCLRHLSGCVITWDGKILPCCYDHNGKFSLDNILLNGKSIKQALWESKGKEFKNLLWKDRKLIEICSKCPEGGRIYIT